MSKKCKSCSTSNNDNWNYCKECGEMFPDSKVNKPIINNFFIVNDMDALAAVIKKAALAESTAFK